MQETLVKATFAAAVNTGDVLVGAVVVGVIWLAGLAWLAWEIWYFAPNERPQPREHESEGAE